MSRTRIDELIDKLISMDSIEIDDLIDTLKFMPSQFNTLYQERYDQYDYKYKCIGKVNDPCVYCNEQSRLWDHVPPLIILQNTDYNGRCIKVRSCYRCNSTLKDLRLISMVERKEYLKGMYSEQLKILKRRLDHLSKLNTWF
jgi:hypothetical protein